MSGNQCFLMKFLARFLLSRKLCNIQFYEKTDFNMWFVCHLFLPKRNREKDGCIHRPHYVKSQFAFT